MQRRATLRSFSPSFPGRCRRRCRQGRGNFSQPTADGVV